MLDNIKKYGQFNRNLYINRNVSNNNVSFSLASNKWNGDQGGSKVRSSRINGTDIFSDRKKYHFEQSHLIFNNEERNAVSTSKHVNYRFIFSSVAVLDEFSQFNELVKLTKRLDYGLTKLQKYHERILFLKKNYFFFLKQLDTLRADQQYPSIIITGCPLLEGNKQRHWFVVNLSRRLHIRFNDSNINMISQRLHEWQSMSDGRKSIPIQVKFKTAKIKNLYLNAAKRELRINPYIKKFGLSVHSQRTVRPGIFVNDFLTQDKLMRYRLVSKKAKEMGYMCYVNNSDVYIRKSYYHEPILVNSRHVLKILDNISIIIKCLHPVDSNNRTEVMDYFTADPDYKGLCSRYENTYI
ncbi:hypothetical protein WDU94_010950 [Cyamophila willieti]